MPEAKPELKVLSERVNPVYEVRYPKLRLNTLALHGGRPYITERLTRFPGESAVDWAGSAGQATQGRFNTASMRVEGRKNRAYLVNNAARIAEKIRQYVFAKPPKRKDVNVAMVSDITRQGDSLNAFMGDVLKNIVATKWCWIGIDAPKIDGELSLSDARAKKIRPYWRLYNSTDVVDWNFDSQGDLLWVLTEDVKFDNTDPRKQSQVQPIRRLWERGRVTEYTLERKADGTMKVISQEDIPIDFDKVPFVLCGELSEKPHFYDDVEDIQKAILDIESSLDTLFFRTVFAQVVLPRSIGDNPTGENQGETLAQKTEAILGFSNAILEGPDEQGITRYIGPDGGSIGKMQEEVGRKREELFDVVGLHLNFTKNFSESADSKHFDHLDPQAVLRSYSQQIKECEQKAWALTAEWMTGVEAIDPIYSDKFRVSNIYEDFKSLVLADNMELPESMKRLTLQGVKDTILEITNMQLTEEESALIDKEIAEMEFDEPIMLDASSMAGKVVNGVEKQATSFGDESDRERDDTL